MSKSSFGSLNLYLVKKSNQQELAHSGSSQMSNRFDTTRPCYLQTIAGAGDGFEDGPLRTAKFELGVQGLVYDNSRRELYIADTHNFLVRKISWAGTCWCSE